MLKVALAETTCTYRPLPNYSQTLTGMSVKHGIYLALHSTVTEPAPHHDAANWKGHPLRKDYPARATEFSPFELTKAKQDLEMEALTFKPEEWG